MCTRCGRWGFKHDCAEFCVCSLIGQIKSHYSLLIYWKEKGRHICGNFLLLPCLCLFVLIDVFFSSLPSYDACSFLNLKSRNQEWPNTNNEVMHVTQILFFHYPKDRYIFTRLEMNQTYIHLHSYTCPSYRFKTTCSGGRGPLYVSFFLDPYQNL